MTLLLDLAALAVIAAAFAGIAWWARRDTLRPRRFEPHYPRRDGKDDRR